MMGNRNGGEAAQRFAERRRREDEAPRLRDELPNLLDLRLEIEERRAGGHTADSKHIRRVVVDSAPALFVLACSDPRCKNGGHDVTHTMMRSLSAGLREFEGEDVCRGELGSAECGRILRFIAHPTYR